MKRAIGFAAVAVLLAGLAGACAQASKADAARMRVTTAIDDSKAVTHEMVDLGKTGFSPGDQLVEDAPLIDSAGKTSGTSYTTVTILSGKGIEDARGFLNCHIVLAGGSIVFAGGVDTKNLGTGVTVPVVGGTGAYEGAGGSAKIVVPNDKRTDLTFDLLIPTVTK